MGRLGTLISRLRPRSKRAWAALVVVVLAALALGGYIYAKNRKGSIYHPHARFIPQAAPTVPKKGSERFAWPLDGYSPDHTRFYPAPERLRPPLRLVRRHDLG